ncbi:MAG: S-methyl-5'-thioinosine phosphorylase [bacterium]|nr:S-methyl-5'-thioinosine phosphorylase [bacterium]
MKRLGIIGGTGFLDFEGLEIRARREDETRWGMPSGPVLEGVLEDARVAFLHRHGTPSRIPPHRINYRANISALETAGCDRIVAVAAVGGIRDGLVPGSLVVPDQIVDYTWGREHTFFEDDLEAPVHVDFTAPYDSALGSALLRSAARADIEVTAGGAYACTQGPRFESAAEVDRLERDGCDIVGMTGMPEAALAREAGIAYAHLAIVVNAAAGRAPGPIRVEDMAGILAAAAGKVRQIIRGVVASQP